MEWSPTLDAKQVAGGALIMEGCLVNEGQMKEMKELWVLIVASRESVWRYRGPGSISCFVLLIHLQVCLLHCLRSV